PAPTPDLPLFPYTTLFRSHHAVGVQQHRVLVVQMTVDLIELRVADDAERRPGRALHRPGSGTGAPVQRGRVTRGTDHVVPAVEIYHHIDRSGEPLLPLLAQQVRVRRPQDLLRRQR